MLTFNPNGIDGFFDIVYPKTVTALSRAASQGDLNRIRKLIRKGSLPQTPDNRGWTAIHHCVAAKKFNSLKLILRLKSENKKYLVNLTTWEKYTPLHLAFYANPPSMGIVKLLLKAGASPKLYTNENVSPLHLACLRKGNFKFVKLLIEYGADPNIQEEESRHTPLHLAIAEARDFKIVRYLISISDLSLRNDFGRTAFLEACNTHFFKAAKLILDKNKSQVRDNTGTSALVYACAWGELPMVQLLIECGANVHDLSKAVVPSDDISPIILHSKQFLPVHSSLSNLEVFKYLLDLTDPEKIKNTGEYCFPMHVMAYSWGTTFYETLLRSNVPDYLKSIPFRDLVNFIIRFPTMKVRILEKFTLFFKYNFLYTPEDVFQSFVFLMSKNELIKNYEFVHLLALMGISSVDQAANKNSVIQMFQSVTDESKKKIKIMQETCSLLQQTVLPLKNICRIVLRQKIWCLYENHWEAINLVQRTDVLPDSLKKFILFETI